VHAYSHAHWHNDAFLHAPAPDDICLATSLFGCLKHLHTLWQLVITGESIIVVGATPSVVQVCSSSLNRMLLLFILLLLLLLFLSWLLLLLLLL
jgi:hypothetical protein